MSTEDLPRLQDDLGRVWLAQVLPDRIVFQRVALPRITYVAQLPSDIESADEVGWKDLLRAARQTAPRGALIGHAHFRRFMFDDFEGKQWGVVANGAMGGDPGLHFLCEDGEELPVPLPSYRSLESYQYNYEELINEWAKARSDRARSAEIKPETT